MCKYFLNIFNFYFLIFPPSTDNHLINSNIKTDTALRFFRTFSRFLPIFTFRQTDFARSGPRLREIHRITGKQVFSKDLKNTKDDLSTRYKKTDRSLKLKTSRKLSVSPTNLKTTYLNEPKTSPAKVFHFKYS